MHAKTIANCELDHDKGGTADPMSVHFF